MANVLTTKEEVRRWLDDMAGTNSFDALLDELILAVSQRFEMAANRKLFSASYIELHDGGSAKIYVRNPPIVSITSMVYTVNYDFDNGLTLGTTEYVIDPSDRKNAVYSTFGQFLPGRESHKVTYVGGYMSAEVAEEDLEDGDIPLPQVIRTAATQQVVYMFKNRKTLGFDNIDLGGGVIQKVTQNMFLPEVKDVIAQLRIRNIY